MHHQHHEMAASLQDCAAAKAQARALRAIWLSRGIDLGHSACLELVALRHGARDWNTLSAQLVGGRIVQPVPGAARLVHDRIFGLSGTEPENIADRIFRMVHGASHLGTDMWGRRAYGLLAPLVSRLVELRSEGIRLDLQSIRNGLAMRASRDGRSGYLDLSYSEGSPATPAQNEMRSYLITIPGFPAAWAPNSRLQPKTREYFGWLSMAFSKPLGQIVDEDAEAP